MLENIKDYAINSVWICELWPKWYHSDIWPLNTSCWSVHSDSWYCSPWIQSDRRPQMPEWLPCQFITVNFTTPNRKIILLTKMFSMTARFILLTCLRITDAVCVCDVWHKTLITFMKMYEHVKNVNYFTFIQFIQTVHFTSLMRNFNPYYYFKKQNKRNCWWI